MALLPPDPRSDPLRSPDPAALVARKGATDTTISVCLPARDEEATVARIVEGIHRELVDRNPLVDELVVVDDGSGDATAAAAAAAGARVHREAEILPEAGPGSGKGNALWKSLHVTTGDVVCWLDADVRNFDTHFVTRLVAPLLEDPDLALVKGFYRRPLHDEPHGGGRVTELVARPLLSHLFPELADIVQPLAGEYAGRRHVLESVPFVEGWGVELGLLVDVVERFGRDAVAQVDLGVRTHRNRSLAELAPQALAILVTALRRAGLEEPGAGPAELVRFDAAARAELVAVEVRERPPMRTVPGYATPLGRARG